MLETLDKRSIKKGNTWVQREKAKCLPHSGGSVGYSQTEGQDSSPGLDPASSDNRPRFLPRLSQ